MELFKVRVTTFFKRTGNTEIEYQFVHAPNKDEAIETAKFYDSFELPFIKDKRERTYDIIEATQSEIDNYLHNLRMDNGDY